MKKSIFFFFLLFSLPVFSQRVAIKNNLVYDALLTPNAGVLSGGKMDPGYPGGHEFFLL